MTTTPNAAAKRRAQAIAGALAGVAVVAVLVAVFVGVKAHDDNKASKPVAAEAPAAGAPVETPPSAAAPEATETAPAQPGGIEVPPALAKTPTAKAGKGTLSKVVVTPVIQGNGPVVKAGQTIAANYLLVQYKTGKVLQSSFGSGQPFVTEIGTGKVIKGWDEGIPGQKVGSRIQLDVPDALAYPGQGDLRFVIDILAVQ